MSGEKNGVQGPGINQGLNTFRWATLPPRERQRLGQHFLKDYSESKGNTSSPRKTTFRATPPRIRLGTTPLVNRDQRCYLNARVQNVVACSPLHAALMDRNVGDADERVGIADGYPSPIILLRSSLERIDSHKQFSAHS